MSEFKNISFVLAFLILGSSCSSRSSEKHVSHNALPETWYSLPEAKAIQGNDALAAVSNIKLYSSTEDLVQPTKQTDAAVGNIFKAYTSSFSELASPSIEKSADLQAEKNNKVPWHLDGLIADFAVSTEGILGAHLFNGTFGLRGTWKKQRAASSVKNSKSQQTKSMLKIGSMTNSEDVARQLEPTIKSTIAAGLVQPQYESTFRANLFQHGEKFRNFCQLLSSVDSSNTGWKVDGLQLQFTVTAYGDVTPVAGVGGAFNLFFDWQKPEGDAPPMGATPQSKKLNQFTTLIADEISNALVETPDVKDLGLSLQAFQVGVALGADGDVGVAAASATIQGKIIFKKSEPTNIKSTLVGQDDGAVNFIGARAKPEHLAYAKSNGIPFQRFRNGIVYRIQRHKFRKGLKRALKMASYFGKKAIEADTDKWKLNEIEAELDISIGGEFTIATVNGTGQAVLTFGRDE